MAVDSDVNDILEIFLFDNLANIANDRNSIRFPLGLQSLIRAAVINNIPDMAFPSDFREILVEYILVRERGDFRLLERLRVNRHLRQHGIKKQRREFFR